MFSNDLQFLEKRVNNQMFIEMIIFDNQIFIL